MIATSLPGNRLHDSAPSPSTVTPVTANPAYFCQHYLGVLSISTKFTAASSNPETPGAVQTLRLFFDN
jgi:hypothetical protein